MRGDNAVNHGNSYDYPDPNAYANVYSVVDYDGNAGGHGVLYGNLYGNQNINLDAIAYGAGNQNGNPTQNINSRLSGYG